MVWGVLIVGIKQIFVALFGFFLAFSLGIPAHAASNIIYNQKLSVSSQVLLNKFMSEPLERFDVAQVDLNDDSLPEFIVRSKTCDAENVSCLFKILAETEGKIIP